MAGIPVYTSSPISPNAAKASETTPTTAFPTTDTSDSSMPAANTATATATSSRAIYSAVPQAAAMPAPTQSVHLSQRMTAGPTATTPLPPSRTSDTPPPPQPGAVPTPFPASASTSSGRPFIPPPPRPGEVSAAAVAADYVPQPTPISSSNSTIPLPLHQQYPGISTPTRAQPPAAMTSTSASHDLSHPPGYVQDTRASFDERPIEPYRPFDSGAVHHNSSRSGGILDTSPGKGTHEDKGIWDTAMSWAKSAGEALSQSEQEVWKAINSKK